MGNSSSSSGRPHDDSVDYGQLVPQGVYSGPRDWNQSITAQLIIARRLAPFYRPLEDYEDNWDDDQILVARKPLPEVEGEQQPSPPPPPTSSSLKASKRPGMIKEPSKPEATVYRGAIECPICFLYYPPNINHSRCCDQAICTECFVQIKRSEPTTTHLVSEPAACPYCVQDNFGVVYSPPPWRAGIGSEGTSSLWSDSPKGSQQSIDTSGPYPAHKRRQKSFGTDSPEVVLTDHIRPDWEAKLAAVRAAVTRRANRRIIMRQVGDRLIPVGVTSGRVHALSPEEAAQAEVQAPSEGSGSRRSRRRQQPPPNGNFEQFMGMGGPELEELMIMEAMRLSLIDHEEQQRKEAEEKKKKGEASNASIEESAAADPSSLEPQASIPGPSTLSPPSSIPSASSPQSSSSLSVNRSSLASSTRSRSPSPNPLQALKDTASGWRRRTSSPPPFSTLSAALSTVSTASAVIHGSGESSSVTAPSSQTVATVESTGDGDNPIPTITVGSNIDPSPVSVAEVENPTRPISNHQESTSSIFSTSSSVGSPDTYDNLPSSPDSVVAREPLIGSTPETPKIAAAVLNSTKPSGFSE
ncbi:hypothetical protein B0H15DRAFT_824072 [Mycena belliarum]|uniref:RING-type domain-containing protein n=1 Tax=Mycena belliarum TaxID=1033014 RepID=A0AAD6UCA4_9AGAR|nr:hypothetical protein B0H15DRAFT_824072 [Mycena belliae]